MTFPSNRPDDDRLVDFLRCHRSVPPPATPELEAQIMAHLEPPPPARLHQQRRWALPAAAAALVLGVGVAWRATVPSFSTATASEVDTFLADTWYGSAYGDAVRLPLDTTQPDWLVSVYATPY